MRRIYSFGISLISFHFENVHRVLETVAEFARAKGPPQIGESKGFELANLQAFRISSGRLRLDY